MKVSYFDNSQDYNVDDSVESDESDKTDKNEDGKISLDEYLHT